MVQTVDFIVTKTDISQTRFREQELPDLTDGQVLLRIEFAAFTANNVTYAVMGEQFGYWHFFPTGEEETGIIPVWGFARVEASHHQEIKVGERVYGYLPMSSHLVVEPADIREARFRDGAAHREQLPTIYNDYTRLAADKYADPELEPYRALWFPLAGTSFGLFDWLEQTAYQGADNVVLVSASSKTALGLACLLRERSSDKKIIGVTSERNLEATVGIGWYDQLLGYEDVASLDAHVPTVMVDFSGNGERLAAMHAHLGDNMKHMAIVGASHWDEERRGEGYQSEKSKLFFMPGYAAQRIEETGGAFRHKLAAASQDIAKQASQWMTLEETDSREALQALYHRVKDGQIPPSAGGIMHFSSL